MDYHLPRHVSFGLLGPRAVALDLAADRYLLLGELETGLLLSGGQPRSAADGPPVDRLVARGLLAEGAGDRIAPVAALIPTASALETGEAGGGIGPIEAAHRRLAAGFLLRVRTLRGTIERWRKVRARHLDRGELAPKEEEAAYLARGFAASRVFVPAPRLCVPDSLALARCLWSRGIAADIYFGVRMPPFAAHSWVQQGTLLLSDPLNVVTDYRAVFRL
ncbi:lasso peptide biosynthesis B2 protein [Sphingopyxis terrae subsp. ummariensis]